MIFVQLKTASLVNTCVSPQIMFPAWLPHPVCVSQPSCYEQATAVWSTQETGRRPKRRARGFARRGAKATLLHGYGRAIPTGKKLLREAFLWCCCYFAWVITCSNCCFANPSCVVFRFCSVHTVSQFANWDSFHMTRTMTLYILVYV